MAKLPQVGRSSIQPLPPPSLACDSSRHGDLTALAGCGQFHRYLRAHSDVNVFWDDPPVQQVEFASVRTVIQYRLSQIFIYAGKFQQVLAAATI